VTTAPVPLPRRLAAELLGSAFLAATVIGSGIAGVLIIRFLYPALTPAQAAGIVVPHEAANGQAPATWPPGGSSASSCSARAS
jgi:hypothetical protein